MKKSDFIKGKVYYIKSNHGNQYIIRFSNFVMDDSLYGNYCQPSEKTRYMPGPAGVISLKQIYICRPASDEEIEEYFPEALEKSPTLFKIEKKSYKLNFKL